MTTKNIKLAIKIANTLKKETVSIAYNVSRVSHKNHNFKYAKSFNRDWTFSNTFAKNLCQNINLNGDIVICDQVVDFLKNKYDLSIREFDSFTVNAYIQSFINENDLTSLEEKAIELIEKYELFETIQLKNKLELKLALKIEAPRKTIKI